MSLLHKVLSEIDSNEKTKGVKKTFALYTNPNNATNRAYVVIGTKEINDLKKKEKQYPGSYRILYQGSGTTKDLQKACDMYSHYRFDKNGIE